VDRGEDLRREVRKRPGGGCRKSELKVNGGGGGGTVFERKVGPRLSDWGKDKENVMYGPASVLGVTVNGSKGRI